MAEPPNLDPLNLDPLNLWRDMLGQWERGMNKVANQAMGSTELRPGTTSNSWPRRTSTSWVENCWR